MEELPKLPPHLQPKPPTPPGAPEEPVAPKVTGTPKTPEPAKNVSPAPDSDKKNKEEESDMNGVVLVGRLINKIGALQSQMDKVATIDQINNLTHSFEENMKSLTNQLAGKADKNEISRLETALEGLRANTERKIKEIEEKEKNLPPAPVSVAIPPTPPPPVPSTEGTPVAEPSPSSRDYTLVGIVAIVAMVAIIALFAFRDSATNVIPPPPTMTSSSAVADDVRKATAAAEDAKEAAVQANMRANNMQQTNEWLSERLLRVPTTPQIIVTNNQTASPQALVSRIGNNNVIVIASNINVSAESPLPIFIIRSNTTHSIGYTNLSVIVTNVPCPPIASQPVLPQHPKRRCEIISTSYIFGTPILDRYGYDRQRCAGCHN